MLANIYSREMLPDKGARVGGNAGKGQRRMIRPNDIANGGRHPGLGPQARRLQTLRPPVEVESQILDTLQHFLREPNFRGLWISEDEEGAFAIRSDDRAREGS